jgi:tetratricopeptide (TPR) repeat protein
LLAIECYNESLQYNPLSLDALCCRGAAYANIDQLERAVADYELALSIDPNHSNCILYLNKIQVKINYYIYVNLFNLFQLLGKNKEISSI